MKNYNKHFDKNFDYAQTLWLQELQNSFESILRRYRIRNISTPEFKIVEVNTFWGQWDPYNRVIKINSKLIKNYSWDTVINVLKHEMAHILDQCDYLNLKKRKNKFYSTGNNTKSTITGSTDVSGDTDTITFEDFKSKDQEDFSYSPHGLGFQKACEHLRVPKEFRSSRLNEGELVAVWNEESENKENHELIRKVERLLSLAQSSNENEALAAMEKVMKLYEQYNLERIANRIQSENLELKNQNIKNKMCEQSDYNETSDHRFESEIVCKIINFKKKKVENYQNYIIDVLQKFYFVKVVYSQLFDAETCTHYKTAELFGVKENVKMAEYVFYFLEQKLNELWINYKEIMMASPQHKRSFKVGVLVGFIQKLEWIQEYSKNELYSCDSAAQNSESVADTESESKSESESESNSNAKYNSNSNSNSEKALIFKRKTLIQHSKEEIDRFVEYTYPSLSTRRYSQRGLHSTAFECGKSEGRNLVINKGLEKSSTSNSTLSLGFKKN